MPVSEAGRPEHGVLELVHNLAAAQVTLVSPPNQWNCVAASRFRMGKLDISLPPLGSPTFGVNYGREMRLERTIHGHRVSGRGAAGYLSILPPDAPTRWVFDECGDVALVFLNRELFDQAVEAAADRDPARVEVLPRFVIRDLVLERIAHRLLKAIAEPHASRLLTEEIAQDLASHLILAHSNVQQPRPSERTYAMAPGKLKRAQEFIVDNLNADMSLKDIAAAAGMSLFHFAKSFKDTTGRSPHQFLTHCRLLHARSLLHDATLSIGQIAKAVGLSHGRFTAVFGREMGMTPSEFRAVLEVWAQSQD
ncbi:MAG: helix-turn-helix transcriptional regulator [Hyphomicrobiaceae bacterium]|nr:helix-turn-helix transcriptional regulator [Hyphomicrobiaceae bacterium]